jgi:hypothetical protein
MRIMRKEMGAGKILISGSTSRLDAAVKLVRFPSITAGYVAGKVREHDRESA